MVVYLANSWSNKAWEPNVCLLCGLKCSLSDHPFVNIAVVATYEGKFRQTNNGPRFLEGSATSICPNLCGAAESYSSVFSINPNTIINSIVKKRMLSCFLAGMSL